MNRQQMEWDNPLMVPSERDLAADAALDRRYPSKVKPAPEWGCFDWRSNYTDEELQDIERKKPF